VFHHRIAVALDRDVTEIAQAALGIARPWVFDLDDVGTPVGQHGARSGDECPLRHFQHADALHRFGLRHELNNRTLSV